MDKLVSHIDRLKTIRITQSLRKLTISLLQCLHPSALIFFFFFFFFLAITSFTTSHLLSRDLETPIRSIRRLFPEITLFTTSFSFNQHTCHSPRRLQHLRVSGQISSFGTQQRAVEKRLYSPGKSRCVAAFFHASRD